MLYPGYLNAETFAVPGGVESTAEGAIIINPALTMLILSDMLTKVAGQALIGLGYVEKLVIPPGVAGLTGAGLSRNEKLIFCGGAGSAAGTFAKEARIPFEQR